jgi:predicted anti-sigma-YlaC factor YlaD
MRIHHEQVMTTDLGQALVLNRATMQTAMLTNLVVIANLKPGFFTGILKILTHLTYTGELENFIIFTYTRIATHHHV